MSTSYIPSSVPPPPTAPGDTATRAPKAKSAYLPGLDGVRAIAVTAVCLFHFLVPGTQGGFLGVDVFFIVSGYLITSQLWTRWGDSAIRLWPFWEGRIRRLFPAVIAVCLATMIAMLVAGREQMRSFLGDLAAAATYTSNWWYIVKGASYGVEFGVQRPPVLQHLWSLAVEEQFYLFWPLIIAAGIVALRRTGRARWLLALLAFALACLSAWRMTAGSMAQNLPRATADGTILSADRWYYGTDSHAMGLLLGATLALVRGGQGFGKMASGKKLKKLPPALPASTLWGFIALAVVIASFVFTHYNDAWLYRWGFHVVALASLLLVAVATRPGPLANLLSLAPLRYLGQRSYSIYLWHWPIVCFTRPQQDLHLPDTSTSYLISLALRVALTLVVSELSYRFIETPIRRHGWGAAMAWLKRRHLRAALAGLMVLTLGASGAWAAVNPDKTVEKALEQQAQDGLNDDDFNPDVSATPVATPAPTATDPAKPGETAKPTPTAPARPTSTKTMTAAYYGDSFAVGAKYGLQKVFKSVQTYAKESRQAHAVFTDMLNNAGARYDVVILHTGNNGTVSEEEFRAVLKAYAKVPRLVVVMPKSILSYSNDTAAMIQRICGTPDKPLLPNVRVVDWAAEVKKDPDLLVDGTHARKKGLVLYTKMVQQAAVAP